MKTKHAQKLAGGAMALLAIASTALAEIKINDNFAVSGYISGSAGYTKADGESDSFMDVDAVKFAVTASFEKVTGTISMHTFTSHDPVILDAYATYSLSETTSVTAGNFLSYLGFEAFDYPNMLQISYANTLGAFIPAYHSGVKIDFASGDVSGGVAVLDSVYGADYYKGDGSFENGAGFEAFLKYSKGDFSVFGGVAYDAGVAGTKDDRFTLDLWAQTKVGATTLAAEYCYSKLDTALGDADGYFWLLLAMQPLSEKWTVTGRLSAGEDAALAVGPNTPSFWKATISPAVAITDNLGVLFEYSYAKFDDFVAEKVHFASAQVIFKF
jgi:hypothetical protein